MHVSRRAMVTSLLAGAASARAADAPFADRRWERRLFFIFAPREGDGFRLMRAETRTPKFGRRDLDLIEVVGGEVRVNGTGVETPTAAELRRFYGVGAGTEAVRLVGKDGLVKLERGGFVGMDEVYALIDTMPMRQQEIRERGG